MKVLDVIFNKKEGGIFINKRLEQYVNTQNKGIVLVLVITVVFILFILGLGVLTLTYGEKLRAVGIQHESLAKMAAEAGYEQAVWWLSEQPDPLSELAPTSGSRMEFESDFLSEPNEIEVKFDYKITFEGFSGDNHPEYKILANGYCGKKYQRTITRTITALVEQRINGWDMGMCARPASTFLTSRVRFNNEDDVGDMPVHINNTNLFRNDNWIDIYINTRSRPVFNEPVSIGESRYSLMFGKDKYKDIMDVFQGGVNFDQPDNKINDPNREGIDAKVDRFKQFTRSNFNFSGPAKPVALTAIPDINAPALQLEFFIEDGNGKVRITNNCTVGCRPAGRFDYKVATLDFPKTYYKYPIYAYHYADTNNSQIYLITETNVKQRAETFDGTIDEATSGGQIYVDGNVIIGGAIEQPGGVYDWQSRINGTLYPARLKGQITVVATGNIWLVSPVMYNGAQNMSSGFPVPQSDNQNVLGLFSKNGVVKVVDPALSVLVPRDVNDTPIIYNDVNSVFQYQPVALAKPAEPVYKRQLPEPMVVQAAITAGGGGWGIEYLEGRTEKRNTNNLVVAGSITEIVRGVVRYYRRPLNGFCKRYYFDKRLRNGILPGDMWLSGKYTLIAGGWSDNRQTGG